MMRRKQHISIPPETVTEVYFLADRICCLCQKRAARQIHHIDENPSNNDMSNLAALCLECHHETQLHGGFARTLSASMVRRFRDAWIEAVKARRAQASTQPSVETPSVSLLTETSQQTTLRSQRLRLLYTEFIAGVRQIYTVAEEAQVALSRGDNVDAKLESLNPIIDSAAKRLSGTLFQIRVEPGADKVCAAYDAFQELCRRHMSTILTSAQMSSPVGRSLGALSAQLSTGSQLKGTLDQLETAIRQHIRAVDRLG